MLIATFVHLLTLLNDICLPLYALSSLLVSFKSLYRLIVSANSSVAMCYISLHVSKFIAIQLFRNILKAIPHRVVCFVVKIVLKLRNIVNNSIHPVKPFRLTYLICMKLIHSLFFLKVDFT